MPNIEAPTCFSKDDVNQNLVRSFRTEVTKLSVLISVVLMILLVNDAGVIIDLIYSLEAMQEGINLEGLGIGLNLADYNFGLNALSLSMKMEMIGIVRGAEHTFPAFQEWNSIAVPLLTDGKTTGYITMFFNRNQPSEFAIPFLYQLGTAVTRGAEDRKSNRDLNNLNKQFDQYKLSPREREVATSWYLEKSALYISSLLGITEGTVRNTLNNIYTKMNVSDRKQFINKLICSMN
ncbi:helix-turn-helix transcriptional regulator [Paenibacillus pedocola]|uniref:helix-turn-helix transcriptional regulator n=1 Tax=Paenibacillus pedocola TaxID=3242193 RepID=UPI0028779264|nr:LuxR C-terminal-related transcriptional regulator [Paenibacillus typhae]